MAHEPPDFIRMEGDGSLDWNMEEQYSKTRRNNGCCNVGKKLLVTGLAISSAPLLLPPLAIISAFGLAASIPYGFFLASYACTETIMNIWLPIPPPPELDHSDEEMVEENGYQEDIDEDEDEEEHVVETTKRGEMLDDLDIDMVVVRVDEEDEGDIGSGDREAGIEVTSVEFEGNGMGDDGDEEEELKETRGLLERMRDEGRRGGDVVEANGDVDNNVEETNSAAVLPHAGYETSQVAVASKPAKSEQAELPSVTIIDVVESGEDLSVSALTIESKVETNAPHKDYMVPSNEEIFSEEKLREKIDSVKKIVGYKATPLETYIDEVNALYAFVGVEPPSPLRNSSSDDLNQLNQKLQFLMSIVGVK